MQLATELYGFKLEHPLMNAAGTCKTLEQVEQFAKSAVSAVVIGSITMEERDGNTGDTYVVDPNLAYSLNALGLPNPGADYYREHLPEMCATLREVGKWPIVSVAGFSPEEYAELTDLAYDSGAWMVELNLGCPNVWGDDGQKPIVSFESGLMAEVIECVCEDRSGREFGLKLSPYSDPGQLAGVAEIITNRPMVKFVTTSNTFPNGFGAHQGGAPVISVEYGGVSGLALKPIALGQVRQFRKLLPETVELIGAGGIRTAFDILEYRNAGATAVQAATAYWNVGENPEVYGDILADADRCFEI